MYVCVYYRYINMHRNMSEKLLLGGWKWGKFLILLPFPNLS